MPYFLMFAGLIAMCVPEDASFGRFALQAGFGLLMFIVGTATLINTPTSTR
jgi:hypothetical protein